MSIATELREFRPRETVELYAPLGVRFIDELQNRIVGDGLEVEASFANGNLLPRVQVLVSRTGVYGLSHLPARRLAELGTAPQAGERPPRVMVRVVDTYRRFLPLSLTIASADTGILGDVDDHGHATPFPIFSAPARALGTTVAVIRAQMHEPAASGGAPAAWALVEAWSNGRRLGRGCADQRGCLILPFGYPDALDDPLGSPPGSLLPLNRQVWSIELRARYGEVGSPPASLRAQAFPDLRAVLAQPPAVLWTDVARTTPLTHTSLTYGRELVISTAGAEGTLLVSPTP